MASSIVRTLPLMKRSVASYFTLLSAKAARSRSMSTLLRSRLVWLALAYNRLGSARAPVAAAMWPAVDVFSVEGNPPLALPVAWRSADAKSMSRAT